MIIQLFTNVSFELKITMGGEGVNSYFMMRISVLLGNYSHAKSVQILKTCGKKNHDTGGFSFQACAFKPKAGVNFIICYLSLRPEWEFLIVYLPCTIKHCDK